MSGPDSPVERLLKRERHISPSEFREVVEAHAAQLSTLRERCETLEAERNAARILAKAIRINADKLADELKDEQARNDAAIAARDEAVAALDEAVKALETQGAEEFSDDLLPRLRAALPAPPPGEAL